MMLEHGPQTPDRPRSVGTERASRPARSPGATNVTAPASPPAGLASFDPEVLGARGLLDLQRSAGNAATEELIDDARSPVLDLLSSSSGSPLEAGTRAEMETRMGHDFSDVRVHTGGAADASARSVQAHAYTVGSDIVFSAGHYQPGSDSGRHLLAHELTHVVQQRSGPVSGTPTGSGIQLSDPGDRFERAAEANAHSVMAQPLQRASEETDLLEDEASSAVQTQRFVQREEAGDAVEDEEL
ncbi:DUF4157 domain-containing protein [Pseudactinotalea sp. HY160]|uniref:eCIS core domain-containing protein n=1 Tax=Pseudactinotalea sp. HY160 TaxID=2654490 RepID=UPI001D153CA5|nr:DUF4157 domain-containing protein [Pseudactinotalea sp. HY160]